MSLWVTNTVHLVPNRTRGHVAPWGSLVKGSRGQHSPRSHPDLGFCSSRCSLAFAILGLTVGHNHCQFLTGSSRRDFWEFGQLNMARLDFPCNRGGRSSSGQGRGRWCRMDQERGGGSTYTTPGGGRTRTTEKVPSWVAPQHLSLPGSGSQLWSGSRGMDGQKKHCLKVFQVLETPPQGTIGHA